ncbi:MAG: hypothetical protein PHW10_01205 [Candidatus Peribacteraceae bacterium]|nr:hypothetical protein [Candidatus Peribacteraceae bacterium]
MKFFLLALASVSLLTACSSSRIVLRSVPQGDFVADTRDPAEVCEQVRLKEGGLQNCANLTAKASRDEKECVDGMSVAGCFACAFRCP